MNILWIEDFGGGLAASENTVAELFGDLIEDSLIDDHWDADTNLIDNPEYITDFFSEHSQFHKVSLCLNYYEFNEFDTSNVINKDVDLIIIDIRLDNNITKENALFPDIYADAKNDFNLNAGFYIFNLLLQTGFPTDSMCLLTGEKNSYDAFKDNCKKLYLQEPVAFEKDENGYHDIRQWINKKKHSKRLQLKRGVLDGISECRKNLIEPFEFIDYIDDKLEDEKIAVNDIYIENYLKSIESNIDNKYFDNVHAMKSLTLLIRSITHEWDNKIDARKSPFVFILKQVRNMIAHNGKLELWDEEDAAILFLISMRHIVDHRRHPDIFPYEAKLFSLIRNDDVLSRKDVKSAILSDKKCFEKLAFENKITFNRYNGLRNAVLEQLLDRNNLDSKLLKERIYKVLWNHYDDYKEDNPRGSRSINNILFKTDNNFKLQLFSALVDKYDN